MRATLTALAAFTLLGMASPAFAGWGPTPLGTPTCTAFGDQHLPVSVPDGAGGVFVVWVDLRTNGFDLYAQRVDGSGTPAWQANGVPVCTAPGLQNLPVLTADGNGGVIIAWEDQRGADFDIYAQRFDANGVRQWAANGVQVCGATGEQSSPSIVADAAGGAILAWTDFRSGLAADLYTQRLDASGVAQWTPTGVAVCTAVNDQDATSLVSDGANGAIVVWNDLRSGTNHDVYARRVTAGGTPQWTANGVALCSAPDEQLSPVACSDGAGGAIVAWFDHRGTFFDVYAQRVTSGGVVPWAANGVVVSTASNDQQNPAILADGTGGAFVAWEDARTIGIDDIYAQRLNASGAALWLADGVSVCAASGSQQEASLVTDARGGCIVGWMDGRGASFDVFAQRLDGNGATQWVNNGLALCNAPGVQIYPTFSADGDGGMICVWEDGRNGPRDLYAQRIERFAVLGGPEPQWVNLLDVPGDEGGHVALSWKASLYENPAYGASVTGYRLYRLDGAAKTLVFEGPAFGFENYFVDATTLQDSTPASPNRTRFRVAAMIGDSERLGAPDSVASLDLIAPAGVVGLTGLYVTNMTRLNWVRSNAADFLEYRIYRGDNPTFPIGAISFATSTTETTFTESAPLGTFYKLTVVDRHGNASVSQTVQTALTLDAPVLPSRAFAFARPEPNPSRGLALLRFSLATRSRVTLELFDEQGRRVRSLVSGELEGGEHSRSWDGRDDAGSTTAPGVYFARLRAEGKVVVQRLTRVN